MAMDTHFYLRALRRHYHIVAGVAFITWVFHASVNNRFYQMMVGMQDAATARKQLNFQELQLFEQHHHELQFRRESRKHSQWAIEIQDRMGVLLKHITEERKEANELHDKAKELEQEALEDAKEAWQHGVEAQWEGIMSDADKAKATSLAQQAEQETMDADLYMNISMAEEAEGLKRLADAQKVLDAVKAAENVPPEAGICVWLPWACDLVRGNSHLDEAKKATSLAVVAAAEMDSALQEIEDAHQKHDEANELYARAAQHGNESMSFLQESKQLLGLEEEDLQTALDYKQNYTLELDEAYTDAHKAWEEDMALALDGHKFRELSYLKNNLTLAARSEQFRANQLQKKVVEERRDIEESKLRVGKMVKDARHHVVHASWYALLASCFAACLLILMSVRIFHSLRRLHPLLVREDPYLAKDAVYVAAHIFILLLAMGFAGDILMEYAHLNLTGRIEIVMLFALVGTTFQAVTLHLVPNIRTLTATSTFNMDSLCTVLLEDVGKRSMAVFLVFGMEVLLCWVNFGEGAFTHAHRLNRWGMWILVVLATIVHVICADQIPEAEAPTQGEHSPPSSASSQPRVELEIGSAPGSQSTRAPSEKNPEAETLLSDGRVSSLTENSSLWLTVDLDSFRTTPSSTYYGTLRDGNPAVPKRVGATFISSWRTEVERVRILFDILIASWALWVIRRDVYIMFKLSRLHSIEAWGKFPWWILCTILVCSFASCARNLRNKSDGELIRQYAYQAPQQQQQCYSDHSARNDNNYNPTEI